MASQNLSAPDRRARPARQERVLEGDAARRLESGFRRIDGMVLAEIDFDGNVLWRFDHNQQIQTNAGATIWAARQHHDWQREDFPGGWATDKENKFVAANRTPQENEAFDFVKTIASFRKKSSAIQTGKLMQYVPQDGVYVYFRYDNNQTVMVISNTAKEEKKISVERFNERINGFTKYKDVILKTVSNISEISITPYHTRVLELMK